MLHKKDARSIVHEMKMLIQESEEKKLSMNPRMQKPESADLKDLTIAKLQQDIRNLKMRKERHSKTSSTSSEDDSELDDRERQSFLKRFQRAPIPTFLGNPDEKAQEWQ